MIIVGILMALLVLAVVASMVANNGEPATVVPTPSPETIKESGDGLEEGELSQYASDPEVQAIGKELEELEKKFDETHVREDALNIPLLDFEVSF